MSKMSNSEILVQTCYDIFKKSNGWKYTFHDEDNFDISYFSIKYVYVVTFNKTNVDKHFAYCIKKPILKTDNINVQEFVEDIKLCEYTNTSQKVRYVVFEIAKYPPALPKLIEAIKSSIEIEQQEEKEEIN